MQVLSSDGKKCGICVRVSEKKAYRSSVHQIADSLRIPRDQIDDVLENWTYEQMRAWLEQFPAAVLDSNAQERLFLTHLPENS
jgi:hypothetical protein